MFIEFHESGHEVNALCAQTLNLVVMLVMATVSTPMRTAHDPENPGKTLNKEDIHTLFICIYGCIF